MRKRLASFQNLMLKEFPRALGYSIRSAATAVYNLLELEGQYDPRVLFKAFKKLHEMTV